MKLVIFFKKIILVFVIFLVLPDIFSLKVYSQGSPSGSCQPDSTISITNNVKKGIWDLGVNYYQRLNQDLTTYTQTDKQGGLYPNGSNNPPEPYMSHGIAIGQSIIPLDINGNYDPNGQIVMISVGMSNTFMEYTTFTEIANLDPAKNPNLILVNGARSGQEAIRWVDDSYDNWTRVKNLVLERHLDPKQVQVVWMKQAIKSTGDFPQQPEELKGYLKQAVLFLKQANFFPNVKIVYLTSRARSYKLFQTASPGEPSAVENGFAVKWLIEEQIRGVDSNGDGLPDLNYDPNMGIVKAPYLTWGPYLWRDDWPANYLIDDCIHPSNPGRDQIATTLLSFFKTDQTASPWFTAGYIPQPPTLTPTPGQIITTLTPTQSPSCNKKNFGDANCDNFLNGVDYSFWLNSQCHAQGNQQCADKRADFNQDQNVDDTNYSIWFENRGS